MAIKTLTRVASLIIRDITKPIKQSKPAAPMCPLRRTQNFSSQTHFKNHISLTYLLQSYGFSSSETSNFLNNNQFSVLNLTLKEIENSLCVISSFDIPNEHLVSMLCQCPKVFELEFINKWKHALLGWGLKGVSWNVIVNLIVLSRKLEIDPDGFSRIIGFLRGFGIKDETLCEVLEGFPRIIYMEESEIVAVIEFLEGAGLAKKRIDHVLHAFPEILGFNVEYRLTRLMDEFRKLGFDDNLVREEIVREPKILAMEIGELSRCLELLWSLTFRVPIRRKIFSEGDIRAGFEVKRRVDFLCSYGLIRREAFEVLWQEPRLIIYEIEEIEKKIEFLLHEMKFDIQCVVDLPKYLRVNFEKQIVPRYNVIKHLSTKGGIGFPIGLRDIIGPNRLRFYNLYVKPYPECVRIFESNAAVKTGMKTRRRHPVGMWKLFKPMKHRETTDDVKNIRYFMEPKI